MPNKGKDKAATPAVHTEVEESPLVNLPRGMKEEDWCVGLCAGGIKRAPLTGRRSKPAEQQLLSVHACMCAKSLVACPTAPLLLTVCALSGGSVAVALCALGRHPHQTKTGWILSKMILGATSPTTSRGPSLRTFLAWSTSTQSATKPSPTLHGVAGRCSRAWSRHIF